MNTKTHSVMPEGVMAFVDGEMTGLPGDFVGGHMVECGDCQKVESELRGMSAALREWRVETVAKRVETEVQKALTAGEKERGKRIPGWGKWTMAAGLAGLAVAGFFMGQTERRLGKTRTFAESATAPMGAGANPAPMRSEEALKNYSQALQMKERAMLSESLETQTEGANGPVEAPPTPFPPPAQPMIARTVSLTMVVKDFAAARGMLDAILARHRGYSAELAVNTAPGAAKTLVASLRLPAPQLGTAVNELKALGRVENETQTGEEVTQQHADLVARLKNARETEQRLQAILQERTGKISDVLAVEQEIARVRGEIEEMEAQQKELEHRVDFATVNLTLSDIYEAQIAGPYSIGARLRNGIVTGYHNAIETMLGIVLFFMESGPTLVIWLAVLGLPVFLGWRRYRRSLATI